jgi:hypothetical protein
MAKDLKPIVRVEDLEARLRRLAEEMAEGGREAGAEMRALARQRGDVVRTMAFSREGRDTEDFIAQALRALEDEIAVAEEATAPVEPGEDFIRQEDRDVEVAKRALVHLKLPQLRRLADDAGLNSRGNQEDLVDRIARAYEADESEIAQLVLRYEEPSPERGLVDRIFAVSRPMDDPGAAAENFVGLRGRYIRLGIAKWFVFGRSRLDENGFWLEGLYRTYSAEAKREGEDFALASVPTDAPVTARVRSEQRFVEVRARGEAESRAILRAIEWGTTLRHASAFPVDVTVTDGPLRAWDWRSILILHFLDRRLPDSGVRIVNLTAARFEAAHARRGFSRRPAVQTVALQGQHLLSSKAACELMAGGRALVEVSLDVLFRPAPNTELLFPIRMTIGDDHVVLLTGFGTHSLDAASALHREVMTRLRAELAAGVEVDKPLQALANQILVRAQSSEPVPRADIFAPPDDWSPEEVEPDGDEASESES